MSLSQVVRNGTFSDDILWFKGVGWTISNGKANANVSAFVSISQLQFSINPNARYEVTLNISDYTSGGVRISFTGGTQKTGTTRTSAGIYTEVMIPNVGNNQLNIQASSSGFVGSIDSIRIAKQTPFSDIIKSADVPTTIFNNPIRTFSGEEPWQIK